MQKIRKIIVHCSASDHVADVESIRHLHKLRGFSDIGYHWVFTPKGEIQKGRDMSLQGAHCYGQNEESIGLCLGGVKNFPIIQLEEMKYMIVDLILSYGLNWSDVFCHNEFTNNKTCPNFPGDILRAYIKGGMDGYYSLAGKQL